MILPTIPDLNWISEQIREIMVYFRSFSAVHYSYRCLIPVRLKSSWEHLFSDQFIHDIFDQAESDPVQRKNWRRVGFALLQWRPLICHFQEIFAYTRKYKTLGRKIQRHPEKQAIYLRKFENDFDKIKTLYVNSGNIIDKSPEEVFFPDFSNRSHDILELCSRFLKNNTVKYKLQGEMDVKHLIHTEKSTKGFRFQQWKQVLSFLHENLGLKIPPIKNYSISRFKKGWYSWTFPIITKNDIKVKIVLCESSGPQLLKVGLHETGHGIHYLNMSKNVPFLDYFVGDHSITETMAYVFERLSTFPAFVEDVWKLSSEFTSETTAWCKDIINYQTQKNAMDLKYRIELFSKDWNIVEAQEIYQDYLRKYMGLSVVAVNNFHFAFRPFLPGDYFLANLYATKIIQDLEKLSGNRWWRFREAGQWLEENWIKFGFSKSISSLELNL
ncbi:MAG: hypothetical protein ACTSRK_06190 [Promethearchaeota archaeon]